MWIKATFNPLFENAKNEIILLVDYSISVSTNVRFKKSIYQNAKSTANHRGVFAYYFMKKKVNLKYFGCPI